jgi:uncharacterized protein (DUF1684 family)
VTAAGAEGELDLLDWRRRVTSLYTEVRAAEDPEKAWWRWREVRDELLASHPQSPLPDEARVGFAGLAYFDYDPGWSVTASIEPAEAERIELPGSAGATFGATRFARASVRLGSEDLKLGMYWLDGYAGGLFVSFRDGTSGKETYGACRYLLDTVKGADLGGEPGELLLDFNFSYNPSCSYDPRWACPLAPPDNRLPIEVRAGERYA